MVKNLRRSISIPIRQGLTTSDLWEGSDWGLIWCWERGRQKREEEPELAERARLGELVPLAWKGGTNTETKLKKKRGTLQYLATWQGLRGDDLEISLDRDIEIACTKSGDCVVFGATFANEE